MKNWKEKIRRGDIAEASKRSGIHPNRYSESCKTPVEKWTPQMIGINVALKSLIEERETLRSQFLQ